MHQFSSECYGSLRIRGIIKLGFSKLTLASRLLIFQSKKAYCRLGVNQVARDIESVHENSPDRTLTIRN